jgi:hypothetical protein
MVLLGYWSVIVRQTQSTKYHSTAGITDEAAGDYPFVLHANFKVTCVHFWLVFLTL